MSDVQPYPDETASSFAWRVARQYSMGLHEFCPLVLGLGFERGHGDLDLVLTKEAAPRFAEVTGLELPAVRRMALPTNWAGSTWDRCRRRYAGQIFVCPDCLAGEPCYSRRAWRSRMALTCSVHGRLLIGSCPNCGEILRYRSEYLGRVGVHWLDHWPFCSGCGQIISSGAVAPANVFAVAQKLENALESYEASGRATPLLMLSARLIGRLSNAPALVHACAEQIEWVRAANCFAAIAALLVDRLWHLSTGKGATEGKREAFNFAVGGEFNAATLAAALAEG